MEVHGEVDEGFGAVHDTFRENFETRGEVGAGLVVRREGRVVVRLWGGIADVGSGRAWDADTPAVVFSATKGLCAIAVLMLTEQGKIDLDAPVSSVWPEFGTAGKEAITVRTLLNHRSGLSAVNLPLTLADFAEPSGRVHEALIAQTPMFEPDSEQAYGACVWGAYVGELVRRVTGKSVGTYFAEAIAGPLSLDAWIGLPDDVFPRVAPLIPVPRNTFLTTQLREAFTRFTPEGRLFRRVLVGRRSYAGRAFLNPTLGPSRFEVFHDPATLALELPWMNGVATAEALSKVYAALIGEVDGVRLVGPAALEPLKGRQSWADRDGVLQKPIGWSQGFVKEDPGVFSPDPGCFGHPGAGGALGWVDPARQLSIGYVMNRMDWRIRSPRAIALCSALYRCLD